MKRTKTIKIIWILLILFLLFFLLALGYTYKNTMYRVSPYTVHSPDNERSLLIATQGSPFKDSLVQNVLRYYERDSVFIKVIDVSSLPTVDSERYHVILILHTWEFGQPPKEVAAFFKAIAFDEHKMIVLSTSGSGGQIMEGVDGMAGESVIVDLKLYTDWLIMKLNLLLPRKRQYSLWQPSDTPSLYERWHQLTADQMN